jgi:hypothetical protein
VKRKIALGFACALLAAQLVRPSRDPGPRDPKQDLTRVLTVPATVKGALERACYDCHSERTRWPWYAQVSPASWIVARDVAAARAELDFSTFGALDPSERSAVLEAIGDATSTERMPLPSYALLHAGARLSPSERAAIVAWSEQQGERLRVSRVQPESGR